ncbi:MAG: UbiD family decarboxylase [Nitrososphaerales archaeon]|jgi:2,5-furandicarboxylate decarboxylase 1
MREFLDELDRTGDLLHVRREVSARHEIPAVAHKLDGKPIIFEKVKESKYRVVLGVCGTRGNLAKALGVRTNQLLGRVIDAIENPRPFQTTEKAPCQEIVEDEVDLRRIPILTHCERDGGPYATAGIVVAKDKEFGYNASYHRLMLIGKDSVAARILPRHLNEFVKRGNREVGISFGNHPALLFAAAVSCEIGKSELAIANNLKETRFAKCATNDSLVPADCELVLEGTVTDELVDEGPFPDITGAYDIVRKQRVIKINRVTHRREPIYQAILPGGAEHRILMGMPREATIFREVNRVCTCIDVRLTPGGSSWLHAAIKIRKESEADAKNALEAAFKGHPSLKHAIVVDEDIDMDDPNAVEWALATRVQLDQDLMLKPNEYGSSLDPSADQVTRKTCKAGVDATVPLNALRDAFDKARIPHEDEIRLEDYLDGP